jgi:3-oxoacyl-[acyl-carrier-protein] synthase-3
MIPASLATEAAIKALRVANLNPVDLDLIIVSTSSPEHIFPATACLVQDRIGATKAGAFDLLAACSGFIYALNMATLLFVAVRSVMRLSSGETSRITDWEDRNTCVLLVGQEPVLQTG